MEESRRVFVRGVAAIGGSYIAAKTVLLRAAIAGTGILPDQGPVIDEQPPASVTFTIGVPASIPYGRAHHPGSTPLTVSLAALPEGITISMVGDRIMLHWNGVGTPGTYQVRALLDDGK